MRHIDHIVVAVRDLERAADLYRRLGFQVGARNRHPWGTENRLVQFRHSFIELITVGSVADRIIPHLPRRFSFGAFVRDYLEKREGIAMVALSSTDATSDAARFAERRIGDFQPFFFERKAKKPDGSETQVAFTLAFASDPAAPDAGFFVCRHHFPENFWNRSFQQHANTATDISGVTLTAIDSHRHMEFLARFSGTEKQSHADSSLRLVLDGGLIKVASVDEGQRESLLSTLLTSVSVQVDKIDTLKHLLEAEQVPFTASDETIVLDPSLLSGVELRFEQRPERRESMMPPPPIRAVDGASGRSH